MMAGKFEYKLENQLNRAFAEGVEADRFSPPKTNPHPVGSKAHAAWQAGFGVVGRNSSAYIGNGP